MLGGGTLAAFITLAVAVDNRGPTDGLGCGGLRSSFQRDAIPETDLFTGIFYIIRIKRKNDSPNDPSPRGYLTFQTKPHPVIGHHYVFADSHHDMVHYDETGMWYWDSQWAFLKTSTPGWYHWINCGLPSLFATWSNWQEEDDGSGSYPFVIDENFPGNHSADDFLFKPVKVGENLYQVVTNSFGGGCVLESNKTYSHESNYMLIEKGVERAEKKDIRGLFIFEESKDSNNHSEWTRTNRSPQMQAISGCSCVRKIFLTVFVTSSLVVLASVMCASRFTPLPLKM